MPILKRSAAPSVILQKLKSLHGDEELGVLSVDTSSNSAVNWAKWFDENKKRIETGNFEETVQDEDEEEEEEEQKKGKNIRLTKEDEPLYFMVWWKIKTVESKEQGNRKSKKGAAEEQPGLIKVGYDEITLFDGTGKRQSSLPLTRSDYDSSSKGQKVVLQRKEVFIIPGFHITMGNKLVQIESEVPKEEFTTGHFFLKDQKQRERERKESLKEISISTNRAAIKGKRVNFQVPWKGLNSAVKERTEPLFNPRDPNAFVLFEPKDIMSPNRVHVVVDPEITKVLRPHQKEGVQFLYNCLATGFLDKVTNRRYHGCILADEMGLGKTIQAVTILYTLLRQGPTGQPVCRRACIVTNWCNEIKKWIGDKILPEPLNENKHALAKIGEVQEGRKDVLVISYDQLKIHCQDIKKILWNLDLIIADEGHRLKNNKIKTAEAIRVFETRRRVILSGTPIQNDLSEFYAMVDWVNPGILSDEKTFKASYSDPIMQSREVDATPEQKEIGQERSRRLTERTEAFILRRTQEINAAYLPDKIEYNIFCRLTPLQKEVYSALCRMYNEKITNANNEQLEALPLITNLKKSCNSPALIHDITQKDPEALVEVRKVWPSDKNFAQQIIQPEFSSKMQFLFALLDALHKTKDKIVVVSNFTETLAIMKELLKSRGYAFFNLDGSTKVTKRQELVDKFNEPNAKEFVFLLSSKAGGVGLNLIGANYLVLFDPDWNPANDEQAMARVWRPGQKKCCHLIRILSTGTIEEKIYQRQISKKALSKSVVEGEVDYVPSFTSSDLKALFKYRHETVCDTHDLLNCRCSAQAIRLPRHERTALSIDELSHWQHFDNTASIENPVIVSACALSQITFIMTKFEKGFINSK